MEYKPFAQQYFQGNATQIAKALGVSRPTVQSWKKANRIPPVREAQIILWLQKINAPATPSGDPSAPSN